MYAMDLYEPLFCDTVPLTEEALIVQNQSPLIILYITILRGNVSFNTVNFILYLKLFSNEGSQYC
jgi:hypothetical protein